MAKKEDVKKLLEGFQLSDVMWLTMRLPIDEVVFTDFKNKLIGLILACDEENIANAIKDTGVGVE